MKRQTEILRIVQETARKLAADHAALAPSADVLDAQYCANRARVMDGALMKLACEIWAMEDAILLGKADLPKV
jgi:hypothetical protein